MRRISANPHSGATLFGGLPKGQEAWRSAALLAGAVVLLALGAGYLAASRDLKTLFALFIAGLAVYLVLKRPRFGFILLLFFTSTLFTPEFFFFVETNTAYYAYEFLLILVVGSSFLAAARDEEKLDLFERLQVSPAAVALTLFFAVVAIKSLIIIIEHRFAMGSFSQIYTFNRGLSFYLLFIPAYLLFGDLASPLASVTVSHRVCPRRSMHNLQQTFRAVR